MIDKHTNGLWVLVPYGSAPPPPAPHPGDARPCIGLGADPRTSPQWSDPGETNSSRPLTADLHVDTPVFSDPGETTGFGEHGAESEKERQTMFW